MRNLISAESPSSSPVRLPSRGAAENSTTTPSFSNRLAAGVRSFPSGAAAPDVMAKAANATPSNPCMFITCSLAKTGAAPCEGCTWACQQLPCCYALLHPQDSPQTARDAEAGVIPKQEVTLDGVTTAGAGQEQLVVRVRGDALLRAQVHRGRVEP